MKKGYKPHQFTEWLHRKHGELIVSRQNIYGDAISMPCVICRKAMEKHNISWRAHDGCQWVHCSEAPPSRPTSKQMRVLGFRSYYESQC